MSSGLPTFSISFYDASYTLRLHATDYGPSPRYPFICQSANYLGRIYVSNRRRPFRPLSNSHLCHFSTSFLLCSVLWATVTASKSEKLHFFFLIWADWLEGEAYNRTFAHTEIWLLGTYKSGLLFTFTFERHTIHCLYFCKVFSNCTEMLLSGEISVYLTVLKMFWHFYCR